ncbi:MAG: alpha-amylase [Eubacteriales bacterium]|jgi:alpha-amylase|nr:alpha-amylase [Eubacteriales bacterium]MDD4105029.1 alpha-amylase [Eubacteriales bacterium]MDD4710629.1 alpha-amylase [Eubacteriales bacterium]
MPDRKEIAGHLADTIHKEIWETLPQGKENIVQEKAEALALQKGVQLSNLVAWEEEPDNYVLMQYFEWELPDDGQHYQRLKDDARHLKELGVGGVWMPPPCKGTGTNDVGYGVYDLYDLGEFDQRGSVRTKYGTKGQLSEAIAALHSQGIKAYADVVLNHKAGADEKEVFRVVKVDENNRDQQISEPFDIEGWTRFTFPGRQGKYSPFQWNFQHFTAVNYDQRTGNMGLYRILGDNKDFSNRVDDEKGNYDYLMFADIDYRNRDVIDETFRWCDWFLKETGFDGMRLDAVKHIDAGFMGAFVRHARLAADRPLYIVGEYWAHSLEQLTRYLAETKDMTALFDVPLHYRMAEASHKGRDYDLRTIFDDTLVRSDPLNTATFVDNHDSQPGQALESWVQDWFKPLAYALILLRQDGYPTVFYGDYYGIGGPASIPGKRGMLDVLLSLRRLYAYGEQVDYFDSPTLIGWVRLGDERHENSGLAVVLNTADEAGLSMSLGTKHAGSTWQALFVDDNATITLDEDGTAVFPCKGGSVSAYVKKA